METKESRITIRLENEIKNHIERLANEKSIPVAKYTRSLILKALSLSDEGDDTIRKAGSSIDMALAEFNELGFWQKYISQIPEIVKALNEIAAVYDKRIRESYQRIDDAASTLNKANDNAE